MISLSSESFRPMPLFICRWRLSREGSDIVILAGRGCVLDINRLLGQCVCVGDVVVFILLVNWEITPYSDEMNYLPDILPHVRSITSGYIVAVSFTVAVLFTVYKVSIEGIL